METSVTPECCGDYIDRRLSRKGLHEKMSQRFLSGGPGYEKKRDSANAGGSTSWQGRKAQRVQTPPRQRVPLVNQLSPDPVWAK